MYNSQMSHVDAPPQSLFFSMDKAKFQYNPSMRTSLFYVERGHCRKIAIAQGVCFLLASICLYDALVLITYGLVLSAIGIYATCPKVTPLRAKWVAFYYFLHYGIIFFLLFNMLLWYYVMIKNHSLEGWNKAVFLAGSAAFLVLGLVLNLGLRCAQDYHMELTLNPPVNTSSDTQKQGVVGKKEAVTIA